jgi:hypothetical protein
MRAECEGLVSGNPGAKVKEVLVRVVDGADKVVKVVVSNADRQEVVSKDPGLGVEEPLLYNPRS